MSLFLQQQLSQGVKEMENGFGHGRSLQFQCFVFVQGKAIYCFVCLHIYS